ncbi:efflux RND transporter periplasmic adaptor subunit [Aureliella helgolandensis]|uniref:Multidrug efflux pump subunit AcrA n=1 Tax=Aureliella helgolandensis TaxID=2527968 RepID=A0A518G1B7_9BACT|nr:efflux RND transporter periplasmic adaptor subunit [Aureliella helgolandensis]QDV22376.1 Multidrug efflux pump subunit AcrA precursor [Aureliella helgolandensis]
MTTPRFLLCIATLLAVGCATREGNDAQARKEKPPQKVTVFSAVEEKVVDNIELVGRTVADQSVQIQARVSGFLLKTHFEDGQLVNAGDLLFSIEPDEYQAIYNQSIAQVNVWESKVGVTEKTFARSQKLVETDAISQEEFEQNQAAVAEARASLAAAQADAARTKLDVDYTQITSPITGRVDRALLDVGNYVHGGLGGGTVLTEVVSDRPIKAVANVDENVRLRFMRRQREVAGDAFKEADKLEELKIQCDLQLQDEVGFPHAGILEYAEIQVNQQTGTSQIRGLFPNESGLLTAGMFVRLRVPVSGQYNAVLVPDTAIGTDQATKFVFVVNKENVVESRTVKLGDRKDRMRVVKSGIEANESVVVAGLQLIRPGVKVDPQPLKSE